MWTARYLSSTKLFTPHSSSGVSSLSRLRRPPGTKQNWKRDWIDRYSSPKSVRSCSRLGRVDPRGTRSEAIVWNGKKDWERAGGSPGREKCPRCPPRVRSRSSKQASIGGLAQASHAAPRAWRRVLHFDPVGPVASRGERPYARLDCPTIHPRILPMKTLT